MNLDDTDDRKLAEYLRKRKETQTAIGGGARLSLWPYFVLGALLGLLAFVVALAGEAGGQQLPRTPLGRAALSWQPLTRAEPGTLDQIASGALLACSRMTRPLPDAERCPSLLVALAFRESSWQPGAVGRLGEAGLLQVHGVAARGYSREQLGDPQTNMLVGARWLGHATLKCSLTSQRRLAERALSAYAGLGCVGSVSARMVLRWADQIHEIQGGAS